MENRFDSLRSKIKLGSSSHLPQGTNTIPREKKRARVTSSTRETRLYVSVNGKQEQVKVHKRPFTGYCELCLSKTDNLGYHHWDDNNLCKGLWLCNSCHKFAEYIERNLRMVNRYLMLKGRASADVMNFDFRPVLIAQTDTPLIDTLLSYILPGSKDKESRMEPMEVTP